MATAPATSAASWYVNCGRVPAQGVTITARDQQHRNTTRDHVVALDAAHRIDQQLQHGPEHENDDEENASAPREQIRAECHARGQDVQARRLDSTSGRPFNARTTNIMAVVLSNTSAQ